MPDVIPPLRDWSSASSASVGKGMLPDIIYAMESDAARRALYALYWRFYLGRHWLRAPEDGASQLQVNYCQALTNKSVYFLIGSGFQINGPEGANQQVIESALNEAWNLNDRELLGLEIVQSGSVSGDVYVKVTWDEQRKIPRIIPLTIDSVQVFYDPLDRKSIIKAIITTKYLKGDKTVVYQEVLTPAEIQEWEDDVELVDKRRPNGLGEVPIVHIRNLPVAGLRYGLSDMADILLLNKELNEKLCDVSDTLYYQGSPIIVIKGAKSKALERGPNRVWGGLPRDADVKTLDMGAAALAPLNEFVGTLKQMMHELSFVPEATLGKMQPISNTSGVALQIQYQPLMEKTKVKRMTYGAGFQAINRLLLKVLVLKAQLKIGDKPTDMLTEVIFNDPMPRDKKLELENLQMEVNTLRIKSRRRAAEELGYDDVDGMLKEAEDDAAKFESMAGLGGFNVPTEPPPGE